MPREYVYGPACYAEDQGQFGENTQHQVAASVGWSRQQSGGHVQLATIRNGKEGSFAPEDGLYMDMDRAAISRLIRLLRRARDQAFGRDE